jgi:hypothetical protein
MDWEHLEADDPSCPLSAPPRPVPGPLVWQVLVNIGALGPILFLCSSFVWLLVLLDPHRGFDERLDQHAERAAATRLQPSKDVLIPGRGRPLYLYRYHYSFQTDDGSTCDGVSYRMWRGTTVEGESPAIEVEYDPADPTCNRLIHTRACLSTPDAFAFPAEMLSFLGLALIARQLFRNVRTVHLLRNGLCLPAEELPKYRHIDGSIIARSEVGPQHPVLYDPRIRGRALALSRLPVMVRSTGALRSQASWGWVVATVVAGLFGMAGGLLLVVGFRLTLA